MNIKKEDSVIIISGKDKGKTGKVLKAFPALNKVLVSGVNVKKVHEKAKKSGSKGQIVEKAMPLHVSNVMVVDPKTSKRTRVGRKQIGGKNVRVSKKSGIALDK